MNWLRIIALAGLSFAIVATERTCKHHQTATTQRAALQRYIACVQFNLPTECERAFHEGLAASDN